MANTEFSVNGIDVRYKRINKDDYISLTDLARYVNPDEPKIPIQTWMRNKDVVSYLGLWVANLQPLKINPVQTVFTCPLKNG